MLVTSSGIVIEVSPEQPEKEAVPIVVTPSGIIILVRPEQFLKAPSSIVVTHSGIVIDVSPEQPENSLFPISPSCSILVKILFGTLISPEQPAITILPIVEMLSGISNE